MAEDEWQRVARRVRERREQLGLTQEAAAAASGGLIKTATWRNVERGDQKGYRGPSLLGVCRALRWLPSSIDRIRAGQEPVESSRASYEIVVSEARSYAADAALNRRIGNSHVAAKIEEEARAKIEIATQFAYAVSIEEGVIPTDHLTVLGPPFRSPDFDPDAPRSEPSIAADSVDVSGLSDEQREAVLNLVQQLRGQ